MSTITERDKQYVAGTYRRFPVELISGKGSILSDTEGKEYIDMGAGIGVTSFGIADEAWQAVVTAQLGKVQHTSNLYYSEPCGKLAQMLCERTGMEKVFFSNSGAEANECAIKVARKYAAEHRGPEYSTIVTLWDSFHGRTLTTLAATGQEEFHKLFGPLTPGFVSIEKNSFELRAVAAHHKVAAVMIECVQGEGGVLPLEAEFVHDIAEWCHQKDILLIVDEVQTGNGRTGELYAYMNYGIEPDIVTTAKGLAGGLPIGATMMSKKVANVLGYGEHGSTFGGNPVCCAAGVNILSRIDDKVLAGVRERSAYLFDTFSDAEGIENVAGLGLMMGLKTVAPAAEVAAECVKRGVLVLTAKEKVRLLPALNIPMDVLKNAAEIIKSVCADLAKGATAK